MATANVVNAITNGIIGCAIKVHRELGPGLLHSVYQPCLAHDLLQAGYKVEVEKPIALKYGEVQSICAFRVDIMVEDAVLVEVKCVDTIAPIHRAQLLTYLRLTGCAVGLILNFNVPVLREGIVRIANNFRGEDGQLR